jgi:polar amino acid transport system substrate-binding protein
MTREFSSQVDAGSHRENESNQASRAPIRFHRNGRSAGARRRRHGDSRTITRKPRYGLARYTASLLLLMLCNASAHARSLEAIIDRGALTLCANPNALPFASKTGPIPGFQIELGEKIAQQLGVKLTREWVISATQYRRADCDLVLDFIAREDAPPARVVQLSRPYHRSGVVLAVRGDSPASSLSSLGSDQRVGVPVGSLVSMTLAKGGTATSPFVLEGDIVAALANREVEAAAVTPATVGWFNLQHAEKPLRLIPAFDNDQDLNWNIAAGLLRPDDKLRQRVDAAIEALLADGTIARIYARYGVELRPPQ